MHILVIHVNYSQLLCYTTNCSHSVPFKIIISHFNFFVQHNMRKQHWDINFINITIQNVSSIYHSYHSKKIKKTRHWWVDNNLLFATTCGELSIILFATPKSCILALLVLYKFATFLKIVIATTKLATNSWHNTFFTLLEILIVTTKLASQPSYLQNESPFQVTEHSNMTLISRGNHIIFPWKSKGTIYLIYIIFF
jgi:hypothetical protein